MRAPSLSRKKCSNWDEWGHLLKPSFTGEQSVTKPPVLMHFTVAMKPGLGPKQEASLKSGRECVGWK